MVRGHDPCHTGAGLEVAPYPYRAMSAYPYGPGDKFPDPGYVDEWLTRVVPPADPAVPRPAP